MYKPNLPYNTRVQLFNIVGSTVVRGVDKHEYGLIGDVYCKFKTYGGTESTVNGVLSVTDTANVETYYRPDIKSSSRIQLNNKMYKVIGEPENIEQRNLYLKFKVEAIVGGV